MANLLLSDVTEDPASVKKKISIPMYYAFAHVRGEMSYYSLTHMKGRISLISGSFKHQPFLIYSTFIILIRNNKKQYRLETCYAVEAYLRC